MKRLGLSPLLVPDHSVAGRHQRGAPDAAAIVSFTRAAEDVGIAALEQYRREWDDDKKAFRQAARHDWCSDRADSFRYLALGCRPAPLVEKSSSRRRSAGASRRPRIDAPAEWCYSGNHSGSW